MTLIQKEMILLAHQAIYRKWRPTVFEDIVGQEHITKTLKNQIINNKIGHAYLFCGTRGTGKTTCAKVFSRAVNCLSPKDGSPCNECEICRGILDGSIMDITEIDAASNNGVDNIREIREDVQYVSANSKYTVYIIDEVHMLSSGAFNALLKTLEEPPENVIFILATTEAHKVPQTILSRCQRFDFKRIRPEDIILRMKEIAHGEGLKISDDGYELLARLADGSMRDGLSVLERVVSSTDEEITAETITNVLGISDNEQLMSITDAIIENDINRIFGIIEKVLSDGKDIKVFNDSLIAHFRDLLVLKISDDNTNLLDYSAQAMVKLKAQAQKLTFEKISNAIRVLTTAQSDAKWQKAPRVIFELAYVKLARPEVDSSPDAILDRLTTVEQRLSQGVMSGTAKKDPDIEKRLKNIEDKLSNADIRLLETTEEEIPEKKKKSAPLRLYSPIPDNELNSNNPIVKIAKNWDNTARIILGANPEWFPVLSSIPITIDNDGIILIYENSQKLSYDAAVNFKDDIIKAFQQVTQSSYIIKAAYKQDIEDNIIDFWSLPSPEDTEAQDDVQIPEISDPLDRLKSEFSAIVEDADETEFIDYDSADDNFSQSSLDDTDDDEQSEEYLEESEKKLAYDEEDN